MLFRARDQYHNMVNLLIHIPILILSYTMHHWLNWVHHNHIMDQIWARLYHPVCILQIPVTMQMLALPAIKSIMTTWCTIRLVLYILFIKFVFKLIFDLFILFFFLIVLSFCRTHRQTSTSLQMYLLIRFWVMMICIWWTWVLMKVVSTTVFCILYFSYNSDFISFII